MTKQEVTLKGFEIVALAGEARSNYLKALKSLQKKDFPTAEALILAGDETLSEAHRAQTDLLIAEANNQYSETTLTMIHGQDHLMTTILLKEILHMSVLNVYHELHDLQNKINQLETEVMKLKQN